MYLRNGYGNASCVVIQHIKVTFWEILEQVVRPKGIRNCSGSDKFREENMDKKSSELNTS